MECGFFQTDYAGAAKITESGAWDSFLSAFFNAGGYLYALIQKGGGHT